MRLFTKSGPRRYIPPFVFTAFFCPSLNSHSPCVLIIVMHSHLGSIGTCESEWRGELFIETVLGRASGACDADARDIANYHILTSLSYCCENNKYPISYDALFRFYAHLVCLRGNHASGDREFPDSRLRVFQSLSAKIPIYSLLDRLIYLATSPPLDICTPPAHIRAPVTPLGG
jgi:hypothetical protein